MTVCYFGIYNPDSTRNQVLIKGLRLNKVKVIECHTRETKNIKYWRLFKCFWQKRKEIDVLVVGFPGHTVMPLAWVLARLSGKKIIFDCFVSMYDSIILDRRTYSKWNILSLKYWLTDWLACQLADQILTDADAHSQFFVKKFRLSHKKFRTILVGADPDIIRPLPVREDKPYFLVHFHGTYSPIQGIPYIIRAAKLLADENIRFQIFGRTYQYQPAIELAESLGLKNIEFTDFIPYQELMANLAKADIALGRFGNTAKAKRCGAFKITEAQAMKKAVITAETPAMKEYLTNRENVLFCRAADPQDLADKILELKNNPALRQRIAENGYKLFKEKLTPLKEGQQLLRIIKEVIN